MQVYVFSGLGSSIIPRFRKGTEEIEDAIDEIGVDAQHRIWNEWMDVAPKLVLDGQRGEEIALVGHSNGVIACTGIAQWLDTYGVKVHYLAAIDPTAAAFPEIGANVDVVDEFHASFGWPAITRALTRGKRGALQFGRRFKGLHTKFDIGGGHVAAASNDFVRDRIVTEIEHLREFGA